MTSQVERGVAAVVGVGEGLGAALARRFAAGYKVALIARSADIIEKVSDEIRAAGGIAMPIQSDATIEERIAATHEQIRRELGPIEILIYNGGRRPIGRLLETTPEVFEQTWRLHTFGAFLWARQVVFAPAKFAVRGLAQVLARDLHPQGIHVVYVNVDGGIDMPLIKQFLPDAKDEDLLKPSAIADAFWYLAHQDRSAWSHELDVRPFKEKF